MGKGKLILAGILLVLVLGVVIVLLNIPKTKKGNGENSNEPNVIEFPPLTLCRQTGGNWSEVNASQSPVNENEGVYSPTTNPNINYKCFCPLGKKWNKNKGCVR